MTNEYLLAKDLQLRRDRMKRNGLEKDVDQGLSSVSFQRALLRSSDVQAHAAQCSNFGIQRVHVGGEEIIFQPSDVERLDTSIGREIPQGMDSHHAPSFYERKESFSHEVERLQQAARFDGQEYSTGKSIPLTCMCGQTFQVSLDNTRSTSSYGDTLKDTGIGGGSISYGAMQSATSQKNTPRYAA